MNQVETRPKNEGGSQVSARCVETTSDDVAPVTGRMVVIVNPATHGKPAQIVDLLRRRAPPQVDLDIRVTPAAGTTTDVTREALREEADVVVAVGGDGTVAQVAAAILQTKTPLGVIPAGSTNITAREAGIPGHPLEAVSLLFGFHRHAHFDVGLCGEIPFLHMAGAGLDSRLFADSNVTIKRRLGWLAYVPPALRHLRDAPSHFNLVIDGVPVDITAETVLVANASCIINPHLPLFPGIRPDDGRLDVLALTATTPIQMASVLASAVTHHLGSCHYITHIPARRIEITSQPQLPVELDGDVVTQTPVTLTLAPQAVRLIVPAQ